MEAIRIHKIVEKDGEISVTGLPFKRGQVVEVIVMSEPPIVDERPYMTARDLLNSSLVGMWEDREDIGDSSVYARQLREQAQRRRLDQ